MAVGRCRGGNSGTVSGERRERGAGQDLGPFAAAGAEGERKAVKVEEWCVTAIVFDAGKAGEVGECAAMGAGEGRRGQESGPEFKRAPDEQPLAGSQVDLGIILTSDEGQRDRAAERSGRPRQL